MAIEDPLITTNLKSHIFSKQALYTDQPLKQSYIRAGHTVLSNDILADEIPWFNASSFSSFLDAWNATKNVLRKNDLIKIGDEIRRRNATVYGGEEVTDLNLDTYLEKFEFKPDEEGKYYLLNKDDKPVILYHPQADTIFSQLVANNNSGMSTNGVAYRLFNNSIPVERYLSVGDKTLNGYPSTGYAPDVTIDGKIATDGKDFYFNAFNGTILLSKPNGNNIVKASCYEYVGLYLDNIIKSLDDDINRRLTNGIISSNASFDAYIDYNNFKTIEVWVKIYTYNEVAVLGNIRLEETPNFIKKILYEVYNIFTSSKEYIDNEGRVYAKTNETYNESSETSSSDNVLYELTGATRRSEDVRFIINEEITDVYINSGNIYDSDSNLLKIPAEKIKITGMDEKLLVLNVRKTNNGYDYKYEFITENEYLNRNNLTIPTITKRV